jgi:N-glycosylase/DNA lyase
MQLNLITHGAQNASAMSDDEVYDDTTKWTSVSQMLESFPDADVRLTDDVVWGSYDVLFTPAFWKIQYHLSDFPKTNSHRLGSTILEEIVACLLGGYGLPSELGLLAFQRLRNRQLIKRNVTEIEVRSALGEPFEREDGRHVKYRFYNQKAKFVAALMEREDLDNIPLDDDLLLRKWLLSVRGIGPKTASWITRNWLGSERVAILDIHLVRAGILAGIFPDDVDVTKSYFEMETKFINFCQALDVKPSNLDALIWWKMKRSNRLALSFLKNNPQQYVRQQQRFLRPTS